MQRMTKYITHTTFASQINLESGLKLIVSYLAANRGVITDPQDLVSIFSARALSTTPMSEIFTRCVAGRYLSEFATIAHPTSDIIQNIPDPLAMSSLVVDLAQTTTGETLSGYRELYRKIVVNITHLVKINRSTGELETSALHELHSMYAKALLVRSYFSSGRNAWLSPIMRMYIIRTYSLFLASSIAKATNLNFTELNDIAAVFALYMSQMLAGTEEDPHCPAGYLNINFLGTRADLMYTADKCHELYKDGLDLHGVCNALSELGPVKLKGYSTSLFLRQCTTIGSYNDTISTYMAFDYPPYWIWLVLSSISGMKMNTMSKMLQQYNLKTAGVKFAQDLIAFQGLIDR